MSELEYNNIVENKIFNENNQFENNIGCNCKQFNVIIEEYINIDHENLFHQLFDHESDVMLEFKKLKKLTSIFNNISNYFRLYFK